MARERTYIMVKPDGVQRRLVGEIIKRFEAKGFKLVALKLVAPGKDHLEKHYADLAGRPFFPSLIEYMSSGPVVAMVWEGTNVVLEGRKMLGATKPSESALGTIRGDFCIEVGRNVCHGSDSVESANKEIALWFPEGVNEWFGNDETWVPARGQKSSADGSATGGPVKVNVEEKNGEISMSIEETNKLRASLGLKPLSLGKKKDNVVNLQKSQADIADEQERARLQKAPEQSRAKRELSKKLEGKSLGEQLKESTAGSALDWVKQVHVKGKTSDGDQKRKETQTQAKYDATALAGMKVAHDVSTFGEGEDVILTLKDSSVLAGDGNELNDSEDELVNVELAEADRREARKDQSRRAVMPAYSGYDDDEFIHVGKKKKARVLAQYDDEADRQSAAEARKFTLDASGSHQVEKKPDHVEEEPLDGVEVVSLAMDRTKAMDDYYTKEEIEAQFAKRKAKKLRKKKKSRRREVADEEEAPAGGDERGDDANGEQSAADLIQQLEEEAKRRGGSSRDRGKRQRPVDGEEGGNYGVLTKEEAENHLRFEEARERANAKTMAALETMRRPKRRPRVTTDDLMGDALDMQLTAAVDHSRRLAQLKAKTEAATSESQVQVTGEDKIAALVTRKIANVDASGDAVMTDAQVGHVYGDTLKQLETSTNVFNDAMDFETRLRSAMEQRTSQFRSTATADAANGNTNASNEKQSTNDEDEEVKEGSDREAGGDEDEEEKDGEVWGEEQPLVGSGVAATLSLLRRTGDLRQTGAERQAGRANDARDRDIEAELSIKDGVKLDYRDEFGRLLTKKEAFRLLSYKFHGHRPGKKKQEKRLRQLKEELEAQKLLSGEGSTKMMKVLEKKQQVAKQAHVVLSGGS
ncbi:TPA: hypothetical protein N0F65_009257 [Lagenidium giganteum]|uniref:nucleoside-diphosphate kinase n=1 Tax=Lagenidium giganteum TaxID=4803 RepID=A0AAV2YP48_9STRA|nr:TPA: hypothetical protein N0F65_009257 [Lagenidium giganteum]